METINLIYHLFVWRIPLLIPDQNYEPLGDMGAFVDAACREVNIDYFDHKAIRIIALEEV